MIRKPQNWESVQAFSDRQKLPLGAYVCNVLKAAVSHTTYGDMLQIGFDIAEGEYKDFYKSDFNANTAQDKKWKGVMRMNIPTDDGSEADGWAKRSFKTNILAIEDSNSGYHWDWNEAQLKGKTVGIVFRSEEWEYNGKRGWKTAPFKMVPAADVKSGNVKIPDPKPLNNKASQTSAASAADLSDFVEVASSELPF